MNNSLITTRMQGAACRVLAVLTPCLLMACGGGSSTEAVVEANTASSSIDTVGGTKWLPLAFPGAEGHGARAKGGRGGRVIKVTTLADSGPGSFREALLATGPRTVVFEVAGTIELKQRISVSGAARSNLTIAGQSAPGDGVQIKGYEVTIGPGVKDVIIRYMRFRPGFTSVAEGNKFSLMVYGEPGQPTENIIVDHCTFSWAPDDTGMWGSVRNASWQWNIFGEALRHDFPGGATPIARGMISGAPGGQAAEQVNISIHKNYFVSQDQRNALLSGAGPYEFVNNLVYNWSAMGTALGSRANNIQANLIGNVYREGPTLTTAGRYAMVFDGKVDSPDQVIHVKDNLGPYRTSSAQAEWDIIGTGIVANPSTEYWRVNAPQRLQRIEPWPAAPVPIKTVSSSEVATLLLQQAGATRPTRDSQDFTLVNHYRNFTGSVRRSSLRDTVWPTLNGGPVPLDSDGDGMPDAWELQNGLNPNDPADGNQDPDRDGYSNLEEYLNGTDPHERN
jgi:pectate lyase